MRIKKSNIPAGSLVEKYLPADYTDAFACEVGIDSVGDDAGTSAVGGARKISPDDIMVAFWTGAAAAGWVRTLFRLRHFLVRFVGLKGSDDGDASAFEAAIRRGGTYRFASVPAKSPDETVLLLTDKHLDAWLSIHVAAVAGDRRTVSAITLVRFRNRLGRIYFFAIRPFHSLVVRSMLRRAIKEVVGILPPKRFGSLIERFFHPPREA